MRSFFAEYKWTIVLIFGLFLVIQLVLKHQREMGYNEASAECRTKEIASQAAAIAKENQLMQQIKDAENAANIREQEYKKLSDILNITTRRLRDTTTAIRNDLQTNAPATNIKIADASLAVLGECTEEYRALAENADGHASDVQTLREAWPK